jgi:hypothetical protein
MEEIFDKDDAIERLLREEGLLKTSPGFTTRVMHLVNDIPQKAEYSYKPLLSRGTWISIILGFLILSATSLFAVASDKATDMSYIDRLKPAFSFFNEIHFSFRLAPNTLMLATIIMASMGLLLILDYFLNRLKVENGWKK